MSSWTIIFMSKILIVPDIHNKIELADAIINQEGDADKCIFLGDIWDDFNDTPAIAYKVAEWVKSRIFDDRFVFLWGNHDIAYGFRCPRLMCSGNTRSKEEAIWGVLGHEHFSRWRFYWLDKSFLLSHAGLHPNYLPPTWKESDVTLANLKQYLTGEEEKCKIAIQTDGHHWFFAAGDARRRFPIGINEGGLLWCDARYEFCPVPNLSQVFGHTKMGQYPRIFRDNGTSVSDRVCLETEIKESFHWSVALDCQLAYYAVIENGVLRIKTSPTT